MPPPKKPVARKPLKATKKEEIHNESVTNLIFRMKK